MKTTPGVACQSNDPAPDSSACRFVARWQATPGGRRSLNRAESRMTPLPTASEGKCGTTIRISDRIGVPAARLRPRPAGLQLVRTAPASRRAWHFGVSCGSPSQYELSGWNGQAGERIIMARPSWRALDLRLSSPLRQIEGSPGRNARLSKVSHRPVCRHDFSAGRSPTPRAYRFGKPEYQNRNEDA